MQKKGNPHALLVGMHTGAATVENSVEFPQKIKKSNCLLFQQSHSWEYILRILKHPFKKYIHPYVQCSIIYDSQDLEIAQVPINS